MAVIETLISLSGKGSNYATNFILIIPWFIIELALIAPELYNEKSVINSVLNKSAIKLPVFVSSVLNLQNLASRSTFKNPIGASNFSSNY